MNNCKNITSKTHINPQTIYYKYRDFKNIEYLIDIFRENELHASTYDKLNDPMEAFFNYKKLDKNLLEAIKTEKLKNKIVSLSKSYKNILMWTHYADEHRGIVMGVTIDAKDDLVIKPIIYQKDLHFFENKDSDCIESFAQKVLTSKLCPWSYEEEVRVLTTSNTVTIKIKKIYFGIRTPKNYIDMIKKYCVPSEIECEYITHDNLNKEFGFRNFTKEEK